ncbi:thioredoxin family protein [candidate division KSB1 bacterium]|nr:thioredoxin family protein [candidate division KSB1 bacterium]
MSDEITMIKIGRHEIGIIGLSEIFETMKLKNLSDEEELKEQLLRLVRGQNYVPDSHTGEYAQAILREYKIYAGLPAEPVDEQSAFPSLKILGPGCYVCDKMEQDVKSILLELNIAANVAHIRDVNQIAEYGMVRTPTLVINGEIVVNGRSLPHSQLKSLIGQKLKK